MKDLMKDARVDKDILEYFIPFMSMLTSNNPDEYDKKDLPFRYSGSMITKDELYFLQESFKDGFDFEMQPTKNNIDYPFIQHKDRESLLKFMENNYLLSVTKKDKSGV